MLQLKWIRIIALTFVFSSEWSSIHDGDLLIVVSTPHVLLQTQNNIYQSLMEHMLHFKTLVTSCGHHSGKIIMPSYVKENSSHYHCSLAYTLYFQEILGLPMIRRRKTWFCMGFMLKNTPKWPFFHDANCWATWYITVFCENNRKLGPKLDIFSLYTP